MVLTKAGLFPTNGGSERPPFQFTVSHGIHKTRTSPMDLRGSLVEGPAATRNQRPHLIRCDCIRWLPQSFPGRGEGDTIVSEMTGFCAWISCHLTNTRAVGYLFGKACVHHSFSIEYKNVRYRCSLNQCLSLSSFALSPQIGLDAPHTDLDEVIAQEYLKFSYTANGRLHPRTRSQCSL